jgi:natural product biosynthesis luciferase-like monooxygenase protein
MELSLMFFGADDAGLGTHAAKYDEILKIARVADSLGFAAIWTPERHFQQVGQVFPNPSALSAALAAATERIAVRAGSLVLPLHHPLRVVEDWALIDNLSRGRIGISIATGWHSTDFVLAPERYADRRERTFAQIPLLRRLWSGETVEFEDGAGRPVAVRPQPRPYSEQLPLWLTSSGNPQTWRTAGELRTNVLAATVGYTREDLAERIGGYRKAYQSAPTQPGAPADGRGTVTLMAHCYVGADQADALERAGEPLRGYLRSYVAQTAANHDGGGSAALTERQTERLTEFALRRHLAWGSVIGSPESCGAILRDLRDLGCDEVACLIDFGLGVDDILAGLYRLDDLRKDLTS